MWQFKNFESNKHKLAIGMAGELTPVFDNEFRREHGPDQPRHKIQELFPVYFQDAQIDITRRQFILWLGSLSRENVWGAKLHGYVLDARTSVNLDTPENFQRAERVYEALRRDKRES